MSRAQVVMSWAGTPQRVVVIEHGGAVTVGDGADATFRVPGVTCFTLVASDARGFVVAEPEGEVGIALGQGDERTIEVGSFAFTVCELGADLERAPRARPDAAAWSWIAGSLVAHAAFVAALLLVPRSDARASEQLTRDQIEWIQVRIDAMARERDEAEDATRSATPAVQETAPDSEPREARRDAEPHEATRDAAPAVQGLDAPPSLARESAPTLGAIGTLQAMQGAWNGPSSPYGAADAVEAYGALMGDSIGSNYGYAGLGLSGAGRGGGGVGEGTIGLGSIGSAGSRPPAPASRRAAMPQSGVLASSFVGGHGAGARLEDMLDRGVTIDGRRVRVEAFGDLERLPFPVPVDEAVGLHAGLERTELLTGGERVHLQIAMMARQGERPPRPRMDVRLVLDRSGSMEGATWRHAIAAAHALVDRLAPSDTFGLVSYADDVTLDVSPSRVGSRRAAHAAIDRLAPGGGTNIDGGLALAQQHAPSRQAPSDVLLVVLLSDGMATAGETQPDRIATRARAMLDAGGVLTTAVGLGTSFDEQTMLSIAREGSGSYHFVRRSADIAEILRDELEERASAVAQDLRLRIELAPGVVATRVYGSRLLDAQETARVRTTEVAIDERVARELGIARDREEDDERGLRMHVPTFRRGDQHVVLMELEVPPGTDATSIARVSLDWKDLTLVRNGHAAIDVAAQRTGDRDRATRSTDRIVKRTVLAFRAGDALQQAAEALDHGDVARASGVLGEHVDLLRAASTTWRDRALARDARILDQYRGVLAAAWPDWDHDTRRALLLGMTATADHRMR